MAILRTYDLVCIPLTLCAEIKEENRNNSYQKLLGSLNHGG